MYDAYRLVHWKDLVSHVPPCIAAKDQSVSTCAQTGRFSPYYPYHTIKEVFYTKEMDHFDICREDESPDCSNKFTVTTSVGDHTSYFGV